MYVNRMRLLNVKPLHRDIPEGGGTLPEPARRRLVLLGANGSGKSTILPRGPTEGLLFLRRETSGRGWGSESRGDRPSGTVGPGPQGTALPRPARPHPLPHGGPD